MGSPRPLGLRDLRDTHTSCTAVAASCAPLFLFYSVFNSVTMDMGIIRSHRLILSRPNTTSAPHVGANYCSSVFTKRLLAWNLYGEKPPQISPSLDHSHPRNLSVQRIVDSVSDCFHDLHLKSFALLRDLETRVDGTLCSFIARIFRLEFCTSRDSATGC